MYYSGSLKELLLNRQQSTKLNDILNESIPDHTCSVAPTQNE